MSSKENILNRIKKLSLEPTQLPNIPDFVGFTDKISQFKTTLEANHVDVVEGGKNLKTTLMELVSMYSNIYSCIPAVDLSTISYAAIQSKEILNQIEAVIVNGEFGVAENAAIWIPEENVKARILTFITLHYFVVVKKESVVSNMHEAYAKIKDIPGFGVFVAGPSKTADIEQSLVIGAHGPKKMTVVLV